MKNSPDYSKFWSPAFDTMEDFVFLIDADFNIVDVNKSFLDFTKKKKSDLIGKKCYELIHAKDCPINECPHKKTLDTGKFASGELYEPALKKWLYVRTTPIFDDAGKLIGSIHLAADVTGRKESEAVLREEDRKYKTLYNSSSDAIMITILDKGFIAGNPATLKMFGCKDEEEFISQSPASLSPRYQPDGQLSSVKADEMMKIALAKGSNFFKWTHRRLDGKEFYATVLLTAMETTGGKTIQATVRDVTDIKETEDELKKRLEALEKFQRITVDREIKMKELKAKIKELETKIEEKG